MTMQNEFVTACVMVHLPTCSWGVFSLGMCACAVVRVLLWFVLLRFAFQICPHVFAIFVFVGVWLVCDCCVLVFMCFYVCIVILMFGDGGISSFHVVVCDLVSVSSPF